MDYLKQNHLSILIIVFLLASGLFGHSAVSLGAAPADLTTVGNPWAFTNTKSPGGVTIASSTLTSVKIGTSGTSLSGIKAGSCTIWSGATTIVASSSALVECQSATTGALASGLTGVTADAICSVTTASSTSTLFGGIAVGGASASSTAGSIVARILNFTGATFTWSATASSSLQWNYSCIDPA